MSLINTVKTGAMAGLLLSTLLLAGCEIDLSDEEKDSATGSSQPRMLNGAVYSAVDADDNGAADAVADAQVWVADADGQLLDATANAAGEFDIDVSQLKAPLVVGAQFDSDGNGSADTTYYSLVNNTSWHTTVSLNPLTTMALGLEVLYANGVLDQVTAPAEELVLSGERLTSVNIQALAVALPEETAQEKFERLRAAGIFEQDGDGNVALDQMLSRAQFAAVAAHILGLQSALNSSFEPLVSGNWLAGTVAVAASISPDLSGSVFTPNDALSREHLAALAARMAGMTVNLAFDGAGSVAGSITQAGTLIQSLMNAAARASFIASSAYTQYLSNLQNSLSAFTLYRPSTWTYTVKGSVTGDFSAPNFSESGTIVITANGDSLPVNEAQLAHWLQNEIRQQLEYYGGNFTFNTLELNATGSGVVGSVLQGQASGVVSATLATVQKTASFEITEVVLTRVAE